MFPRLTKTFAWLGVALGLSAAAACSATDPASDGSYAQGAEACVECKTILVECTSTSIDESQFIACRDQWQECQMSKGLAHGECSNPGDNEACDLCRERLVECKADGEAEACESEFGVCKAFLITRGDVQAQCREEAPDTNEVGCGICQQDYAACLSDVTQANAAQICADKRVQCLTANTVPVEACPLPAEPEGCTLCGAQYEQCYASGGPSCPEGFTQCAGALSPNAVCDLPTEEGTGGGGAGGGGEGGGGQGGQGGQGGGTTGACGHSTCEVGPALDETCSDCAAEVCTQDSWCCTNEWDNLCVDIAEGIATCGCGS